MQASAACRIVGPSFFNHHQSRCRSRLSTVASNGGGDSGVFGTIRRRVKPGVPNKGGRVVGDDSVVFVAGSTGRLGLRAVRELLAEGYSVRAGCRNIEKAEMYVDAARSMELLTKDELSRLTVVEFDIENPDTIGVAIGKAAAVVCCVGAPESEILDVQAPYRIDGEGTISLIEEAEKMGSVSYFLLVTSLGTEKFGWPAGVLNLFWGVLVWKRKAEQALENSQFPSWTIVRPGGMERPTDSYSETNATRMFPKNTQFGGQVSRLQVAKVIAACVNDKDAAARKILEVVTEEGGETIPLEEMIQGIEPKAKEESQEETYAASE